MALLLSKCKKQQLKTLCKKSIHTYRTVKKLFCVLARLLGLHYEHNMYKKKNPR